MAKEKKEKYTVFISKTDYKKYNHKSEVVEECILKRFYIPSLKVIITQKVGFGDAQHENWGIKRADEKPLFGYDSKTKHVNAEKIADLLNLALNLDNEAFGFYARGDNIKQRRDDYLEKVVNRIETDGK